MLATALKWPEKDNIILISKSPTFSAGERLRFPLRAFDSLCSVSWRGEEGKVEVGRWLFGEEDSDSGVERGLAIDRGRGRARDCEVEIGGEEEGVARVGRVARACGGARVRSPGQGWPPIPLSPTCRRDVFYHY